jgi:pectinesterase
VLARVVYQNTKLSNIINSKGWTTMAEGTTLLYYKYNNKGAGSNTSKREYKSSISSAISQKTVLSSDWNSWVDTKY